MKKLWLVREPCTILFDVKPIHDALGTDKMKSSIEVHLFDEDYDRYMTVVRLYTEWQEILNIKYNGRVAELGLLQQS
jgi:hypothetical protein